MCLKKFSIITVSFGIEFSFHILSYFQHDILICKSNHSKYNASLHHKKINIVFSDLDNQIKEEPKFLNNSSYH